ncbi:hypothetical protein JCGZ_11903 [Jatropha curcas]|uniref:Aminotransferase-like plant mobile domain-containing protein n=1 Tax=Jatropha curcas TaxID=180498 RepID=A0A067KSG8_JATCU|nr:hypothetical protein JCGZ_11903 [Jatropha curcas]
MCVIMGHHPVQDETPALPPGPRYDPAEIAALCPIYLPDGIDPNRGLPLEPFLNRVLSMDADHSWVWACCFLLLNVYAMKNRQPGIGDFRLLTVVHDMQVYRRTVFVMIMGETICWVRDIALHDSGFVGPTPFDAPLRIFSSGRSVTSQNPVARFQANGHHSSPLSSCSGSRAGACPMVFFTPVDVGFNRFVCCDSVAAVSSSPLLLLLL